MAKWPAPVYHIELDLEAPVSFAFRWCTDYRTDDAARSKERFERRILSRSRERILFEDAGWTPKGWIWRRSQVSLRPPGRWHADTVGSFRTGVVDYSLTPLAGDRSRFSLTFRRRPSSAHPEQPTKRELEEELTRMWTNYAKAMARDYRASRQRRARPR